MLALMLRCPVVMEPTLGRQPGPLEPCPSGYVDNSPDHREMADLAGRSHATGALKARPDFVKESAHA